MKTDYEISLVNAFVVPQKRERYVGFLLSPKRRVKFLRQLYHFGDFDPACIVHLRDSVDSGVGLLAELRRRGAGEECYVISACNKIDGVTQPLAKAIGEVFALQEGTILSCVPGRLAYYEGEAPHNRFILDKI